MGAGAQEQQNVLDGSDRKPGVDQDNLNEMLLDDDMELDGPEGGASGGLSSLTQLLDGDSLQLTNAGQMFEQIEQKKLLSKRTRRVGKVEEC